MSLVIKSPATIGLLSGLVLPPLLAKFVLEPIFIQRKYDEVQNLKYNVEYLGWHVRGLEEASGFKEDKFYSPLSLFPEQRFDV
ncbi:uncharacterized protein AC631_04373 [Debaryomyces fabryi]|uniref:Uncharacterized protein n=1 Tax=Debaryomyces fabryi TaxID=58627 RepID=A0A0V1PUI3_9ASCO|nr:uncharacterized protein AC631_04373 [Debaryomyces fabryi]KRZ99855.1 hypothetical protein AC631_04373 [Debaryomyces fabryi]CUM54422.1 unnamed protein product [Debaryomyces fabryi]